MNIDHETIPKDPSLALIHLRSFDRDYCLERNRLQHQEVVDEWNQRQHKLPHIIRDQCYTMLGADAYINSTFDAIKEYHHICGIAYAQITDGGKYALLHPNFKIYKIPYDWVELLII